MHGFSCAERSQCLQQRARINDAEFAVLRFYQRTDIDATLTAEKKVSRTQSEAIAVERLGISNREFDRATRI